MNDAFINIYKNKTFDKSRKDDWSIYNTILLIIKTKTMSVRGFVSVGDQRRNPCH